MKNFFREPAHQRAGLMALTKLIPEGSVGVEIGCAYGESAAIFVKSGRVRELLCVDSWEGDCAEREPYFDRRIEGFKGKVVKLKMRSLDAAAKLADFGAPDHAGCCLRTYDFVYIDGCHVLPAITADIEAWVKFVKIGGFISGHDYRNDVKTAVDKFFGKPDKQFVDSSWLTYIKS